MPENFHACAVSLRGRGVLVAGASGSGKTRLALALVRETRRDGQAAAFVSDDQVLLAAEAGRLIARAPDPIFGLVEIRGLGPVPIRAERSCAVDLLIRLVPEAAAPRMAEGLTETLAGIAVQRLDLAQRDCGGAVLAANAFLFGAAF